MLIDRYFIRLYNKMNYFSTNFSNVYKLDSNIGSEKTGFTISTVITY